MSQNWTDDVFAGGHVGQTDLQNMENNFAAIKSSFSGASQPSNQVPFMLWGHTSNKLLKMRNDDDSAWWGLMHGDTDQKILVYRNAAMDGWAIDSTVTDRLVAIKGGTTYTTGAATAGSWNQPDHTLVASEIPAHTHGAAGAHNHTVNGSTGYGLSTVSDNRQLNSVPGENNVRLDTLDAESNHTHSSVGGDGAHNHGSSYRPAAAVHTMQYLDI
jgi:hypothetical protein